MYESPVEQLTCTEGGPVDRAVRAGETPGTQGIARVVVQHIAVERSTEIFHRGTRGTVIVHVANYKHEIKFSIVLTYIAPTQ